MNRHNVSVTGSVHQRINKSDVADPTVSCSGTR
jgi:hypothetical protein